MSGLKVFFLLIGRVFLSIIFILSAIHKITDWNETESGVIDVFSDWSQHVSDIDFLQNIFIQLTPYVDLILMGAIGLELLGAVLILFAIRVRLGAFLLILFLIPTTILMHQFWFLDGLKKDMQMVMFLKNIAILGALFYMVVYGSGEEGKKDAKFQQPD